MLSDVSLVSLYQFLVIIFNQGVKVKCSCWDIVASATFDLGRVGCDLGSVRVRRLDSFHRVLNQAAPSLGEVGT